MSSPKAAQAKSAQRTRVQPVAKRSAPQRAAAPADNSENGGGSAQAKRLAAEIERALASGRHENPTRHPAWFTTAYFHLPGELAAEVSGAGFTLEALLAIEGVGTWLPDVDDWLDDPRRRDALLRAIARVEAEPSLLGASPHVLAVGVKGP